jgi:hypothetical protein
MLQAPRGQERTARKGNESFVALLLLQINEKAFCRLRIASTLSGPVPELKGGGLLVADLAGPRRLLRSV